MNELVARAPARIDFGGGWTDVPPYSEEQGGVVCNLAIQRYATVRITRGATGDIDVSRDGDAALAHAALKRSRLYDVSVHLRSGFPVGAGLGGSSAAGVAMCGALATWRHEALDRSTLAERSRQVEVDDLDIAGGRQDHYAAAFGGALGLAFSDVTDVSRIALSSDLRAAIERRCIVTYTGQSRISGDTIRAVLDAYRASEPRVLHALDRMRSLALLMIDALRRASLDDLGRLVGEHWAHQRALHPSIPTPRIDTILERARRAGALGGKALGASGGGSVLLVAAEGAEAGVRDAVRSLGEDIPVGIDDDGFTIVPSGPAERR